MSVTSDKLLLVQPISAVTATPSHPQIGPACFLP